MKELRAQDFATTAREKVEMYHRAAFTVLSGLQPQKVPVLTYIVGQPASGKSVTIGNLVKDTPGAVIDSDQLRLLHPQLDSIMRRDPLRMDILSNEPVQYLFSHLLDDCRQSHYNVYLENTLTNTNAILSTVEGFRQEGYRINFELVATPPAVSRLAIAVRFFGQVERHNPAPRWTSVIAHDNSYEQIPYAVAKLKTVPSEVRVWSAGRILYDGNNVSEALTVFKQSRDRVLSSAEIREYSRAYRLIDDQLAQLAAKYAPAEKLRERILHDTHQLGVVGIPAHHDDLLLNDGRKLTDLVLPVKNIDLIQKLPSTERPAKTLPPNRHSQRKGPHL